MILHEKVENVLRASLQQFYPEWIKLQSEPLDQRRVLTPERVGAYRISIEPYHGMNSSVRDMALIPSNQSVQELKSAIVQFQPALLGYLSTQGQSIYIGDISKHFVCWCQYIDQKLKESLLLEDAISNLISDLSNLISTSEMTREIFAPVDNLLLSEDCDQIEVDSNLILKKLTMEELQELVSEDIMFSNGRSQFFQSAATVIICKRKDKFILNEPEKQSPPLLHDSGMYDPIEGLISCLHILKPGKVSIIECQHRFYPLVLPFQKFSIGSFRPNFTGLSFQLNKAEAETLRQVYLAYNSIEWAALRIAIKRLADAENRISSTDSLLDSIIGLEVLLNPVERSELAFRVALHYSYLGEKSDRKSRYNLMRKIQEIRNTIVHGGANVNSSRASEIAIYSEHAKKCLREVILKFLNPGFIQKGKKMDANFWVDFIITK